MNGWALLAMCAFMVCQLLWLAIYTRLHYRLARVEYVQMRRLMGEHPKLDGKSQDVIDEIMEALKYNKNGILDAAKEALKN